MRRLLARCASIKVRCRPSNLQNGCSAFTTPAPCVQRLPAPAASVSTATSPPRRASRPALRKSSRQRLPWHPPHRASCTSSMSALAGRRFWARPIRPFLRSARICSCCTRSKPFCSSNRGRLCPRPPSAWTRGNKTVKQSIAPCRRSSGRLRQAAPNLSSSARRSGRDCGSARSQRGAMQRVITARQQRLHRQQLGQGAALVDREIINDRFHRERQGVLQLALGLRT